MSCLPSTRASQLKQLDLASDGRLLRLVSGRVRDLVRGSSEGLGLVIEGWEQFAILGIFSPRPAVQPVQRVRSGL